MSESRSQLRRKAVQRAAPRFTAEDYGRMAVSIYIVVEGSPAEHVSAALRQAAATERAYQRLREAVERLLAKMDEAYQDPRYIAVWSVAQNHQGPYKGAQWIDEELALIAALKETP